MNGDRFQPIGIEPHTDCPDFVEVADAYQALLTLTDGDRVAAAILATGAVLAEAVRERP